MREERIACNERIYFIPSNGKSIIERKSSQVL